MRTILSQNTTDTNSSRAFAGLKAAFPEWEAVRTAPEGAVEESIRCGGLADIKVARIKVPTEDRFDEVRYSCSQSPRPGSDNKREQHDLLSFQSASRALGDCLWMLAG